MRPVQAIILVCSCLLSVPGLAEGLRPTIGVGVGFDFYTYVDEGMLDIGRSLEGYALWSGGYPVAYRIAYRWTRVAQAERFGFEPDISGHHGHAEEITHITRTQFSVLWFEDTSRRAGRYAGGGIELLTFSRQGDRRELGYALSPICGVSFNVGGHSLSLEGGAELVFLEHDSFLLVPLRFLVSL